jgi:hypothetical protein
MKRLIVVALFGLFASVASIAPDASADAAETFVYNPFCYAQYSACTNGCKSLPPSGRRECLLECKANYEACMDANG